jgi:oligo-1,6-glucosidase
MFAAGQPDLNWENPDVRETVYGMMRRWFDKGIDGFRMDVISCISKPPLTLASDGGPGMDPFNGPLVHAYLKEMNQKVLSRYDIMTVGETATATPEDALHYAGFDTGELNMVIHFQHVGVDKDPVYGKWTLSTIDLVKLKKILNDWQTVLHNRAWNSLYWDNHDQPRAVSRFGNDSTELFREKSAKMLGACLHMMQGTPYIYQGEELGMTNYPFTRIEEVADIGSVNAYRELVTEKKVLDNDTMLAIIRKKGRDNGRTPMQWDASENAGFSTGKLGKPWLPVNPNYKTINAAAQVGDPNSVFSFYKTLIKLRKEHPIIVYGDYEPLLPHDRRVFAYRRHYEGKTLLALCNFSAETVTDVDLTGLGSGTGEVLIANYPATEIDHRRLLPYETRIYLS